MITHFLSTELIKNNAEIGNRNIIIDVTFNNIFIKPEYDNILNNLIINEDSLTIKENSVMEITFPDLLVLF